jgi:hypothetical protein
LRQNGGGVLLAQEVGTPPNILVLGLQIIKVDKSYTVSFFLSQYFISAVPRTPPFFCCIGPSPVETDFHDFSSSDEIL